MPKVSINIPCFNSAKFIKETIDSVLSQTYDDFELILTDDGSTDGTGDVIKSFKDPRIRYFYKDNEGLAKTRNRCLAASSGEYIAFLDHDDIWFPEKLEKQVKLLDGRGDIALVYSNYYRLYRDGSRKVVLRGKQPEGDAFGPLLRSFTVGLLTAVVRKKALEELAIAFDETLIVCEDYDLFLRIARNRKISYVDEPLAMYRIHPGMQSVSLGKRYPEEIMYVIDKLKKMYPEIKGKFPGQLDYITSHMNFSRAKIALLENDPARSREILRSCGWAGHSCFFLYCATYIPRGLFESIRSLNARYITKVR